jgi:hypothetical protein
VPDDVKPLDPSQPVAAPANASSRLAPRTSSPVRRTSFAATEEDRFSRVSSPIPAAFDADAAGGQPRAADDATAEPDAAVAGGPAADGLPVGGPTAGEPADDPAPLAADVAAVFRRAHLDRIGRELRAFRQARDRGLAASDLADIARAAVAGQVATLLIEADRFEAGRFDRDTGAIEFDGAVPADLSRTGDRAAVRAEDLLGAVAETVLMHGGDVLALARNDMPTETAVAAIYRYA